MAIGGRSQSWDRFRVAAGWTLAFYALLLAFDVGGVVISNLGFVLAPLVAAVMATQRARQSTGRARLAWTFLAVAAFDRTVANVIWAYNEVVLHVTPFPSAGDYVAMAFVPFAAIGLYHYPAGPAGQAGRLRHVLDGLLVAASIFLIAWATLLSPLYEVVHASDLDVRIAAFALPIGDVALFAILVGLAARSDRRARPPLLLLAGGFFLHIVADSAFLYYETLSPATTGDLADVSWAAGFLLMAAAAQRRAHRLSEQPHAGPPSRSSVWVPYIAVLVAVGYIAYLQQRTGRLDTFVAYGALSIVLLVGTRQLLVLLDNRRLTRELQEALDGLRAAQAFRTQLLNNVSHDLANPMSPILIQLELLEGRSSAFAPENQKSLEIVRRNTDQVHRMLKDLKDLATLESGDLKLDLAPLEMGPLLRATVESFQPLARQRGVRLAADVPAPVVTTADVGRITQVLNNLVGNALKFTPTGGTITLRAKDEGAAVRVEVEDTGRGLAPDEVRRLFRPFSQVHDPGTVAEKGSGLGLYICKGILERHAGWIGVRSDGPGAGSTFYFVIPLRPQAAIGAFPVPAASSAAAPSNAQPTHPRF